MLYPNVKICAFLALFCCLKPAAASAQGCSDAGFCTLSGFKPNVDTAAAAVRRNTLKAGVSYGLADHSITAIAPHLEYNRQMNDRLRIDAKLTSMIQQGNGITASGLSDLFLSANYMPRRKASFTLGVKIPFTDAGRAQEGLPLPMDYQSSLGTVDLLAGVGFSLGKLQLVTALQQPLTQNNNRFLADDYPANSPLREFQSTRNFQRSGDVLLRIAYLIRLDDVTLTPGLLSIYHLQEDRYTAPNGRDIAAIKGSDGLTLNANLHLDYRLNERHALQFSGGIPLVVRKVRPDGLTRGLVAGVEYRVRF